MPTPRRITDEVLGKARELRAEGLSQRATADRLGVSQSALSVALRRAEEEAGPGGLEPTVEVAGDTATLRGGGPEDGPVTEAGAARLMAEHGFSASEWHPVKASMTEWGWNRDLGQPYKRLRVDVVRRSSLLALLPATHVPVVERPSPVVRDPERPQVGLLLSDQHAPYHDRALHALVLQLLRDLQPDFVVLAGDGADLPRPSRHRRNPAWDATPQESVNGCYRLYRDYVEAAPLARFLKVLGNHDVRIRNYLLESSAPELATLHPAPTGDEGEDLSPAVALRRLLHLEALGIECVEPAGEYGDELVYVSPKLAVFHGERTGKNPGATELEKYGHSVAFGHTHRMSTTYRTRWGTEGESAGPLLGGAYHRSAGIRAAASVHVAMEIGCLCEIEGGLGYDRRPNWQNAAGLVTVWPDGRFHLEHAPYVGGHLYARGERWSS